MAGKTLAQIKESIIRNYNRNFPGEETNGHVFSAYILEQYAKLLYKIYQKAEKK